MSLIDSPWHDLQEEGIRAVYGEIRMEVSADLIFDKTNSLRIAGYQDLIH